MQLVNAYPAAGLPMCAARKVPSTLRTLPAPDRLYPVFAIACPAFMYKHEAATATATATAIVTTTAATAFAFATTAAAATTEL